MTDLGPLRGVAGSQIVVTEDGYLSSKVYRIAQKYASHIESFEDLYQQCWLLLLEGHDPRSLDRRIIDWLRHQNNAHPDYREYRVRNVTYRPGYKFRSRSEIRRVMYHTKPTPRDTQPFVLASPIPLHVLNKHERLVLELIVVEGKSDREAGIVIGKTRSGARWLLALALHKLKKAITHRARKRLMLSSLSVAVRS